MGVRAEWGHSRLGVRLVSLRGPVSISQPECVVQVYVDNHRADADELAHIQSGDLAGVEYYSIAPPGQYSANAACGVLLCGRNASRLFLATASAFATTSAAPRPAAETQLPNQDSPPKRSETNR